MTTSDQATPGQQASRSNLRDVADTLTAYLAIPVILLYPFGFLALFLQFTRYFGLDFYTAWYAASLVNRMVAIGLGATILVAALLGSALLAGNVGQSLLLRKDQAREDQAGSRTFWRRTLLIVRLGIVPFLVLIVYVLYSRILAAGRVYGPSISGREPIDKCLAGALRHQLNLWPDSLGPALILVVGAWWGGWLIFSSYQRYCRSVPSNEGLDTIDYHTRGLVRFLISGITQGWIWRGLLAAYACGIAASLMLAWATPAFMPYMTYGPTPDSAKQVGDLKDRFLSYAEGRWYFTHRVEAAAGEVEGYRIVGLSDSAEEAKYVRIRPHPARAARVAPFPWSEKAVTRTTQPCED